MGIGWAVAITDSKIVLVGALLDFQFVAITWQN